MQVAITRTAQEWSAWFRTVQEAQSRLFDEQTETGVQAPYLAKLRGVEDEIRTLAYVVAQLDRMREYTIIFHAAEIQWFSRTGIKL